jgi:hypothetical protein
MIQLQIDTKQLMNELDIKVNALKKIASPEVLEEISKAVFAITGPKFVSAVDSYSRRNPKSMHHVYEWGRIGDKNARLFVIERVSVLGGSLVINSNFIPSRTPVPINPEMLRAGKTGKSVTSKNIFRDKASIMESGRMVSYRAKKVLAFMGTDGMVFIAPGTQVNIASPGGKGVKSSFGKFMLDWYTKNGNVVMNSSGFYERMVDDISKVLSVKGAGSGEVKQTIARLVDIIDVNRGVIK